ncbi:MAG: response regulator [Treponema sp.]|nr:response regulator [Treponema sp.]
MNETRILRVMAIDDDAPVRASLKQFDWKSVNAEWVDEANNGQDGLNKCRELRPDVVFLDIVMPIMDGLTMLSYLRDELPHVYVIILTCHQDYSYMRKAMQLGANDYILKINIDNNELFRVMKNLDQRIRLMWDGQDNDDIRKLLSRSAAFQQWWQFNNTHYVPFTGSAKVLILVLKKSILASEAFFIVNGPERELYPKIWYILDMTKLVLFFPPDISEDCFYKYAAQLAALNIELMPKIITGGIVNENSDLHKTLTDILTLIKLLFYKQPGEILESSNDKFSDLSQQEEKNLMAHWKNYPLQGRFEDFLQGFFKDWAQKQQIDPQQLKRIIVSLYIDWVGDAQSLTEQAIIEFFQTEAFSLDELIESTIECLCSGELAQNLLRWEIRTALKFINNSYKENIYLADVAMPSGLSPNYLNYLFQKYFNVTVNEYILRFRIDKAKELLRSSTEKIYEIAERIGIPNYRYFSSLFKEQTGLTPKAYQKSCMGKSNHV